MGAREKEKSKVSAEKILRALLSKGFTVTSRHSRTLPNDPQQHSPWLRKISGVVTMEKTGPNGQKLSVFFHHAHRPTPKAIATIAQKAGVSFSRAP